MKLHYSQTIAVNYNKDETFDYHMKLHYSQTMFYRDIKYTEFDYHMKLHYSQTTSKCKLLKNKFD